MTRHLIHIHARPYSQATGKPYAEIQERGVHRPRRVKLFKARSACDCATDDVFLKACEWAGSKGYELVFRAVDDWFSIWGKDIGPTAGDEAP